MSVEAYIDQLERRADEDTDARFTNAEVAALLHLGGGHLVAEGVYDTQLVNHPISPASMKKLCRAVREVREGKAPGFGRPA